MSESDKRILYVESNADRSRRISDVFSQLNYRVVSASSAADAAKAWDTTRPHIVVLNTDGQKDGAAAVSELQKQNGETPFILLTSEAALMENRPSGVVRVLGSPAEEEDIVDSVERAIGLPAPPQEVSSKGSSSEIDEIEYKRMEAELDSLHEQLHFYQKQLDQVSVAGEREGREIDQVLKDFQDQISQTRQERDELKDEIDSLKRELKEKDEEASALDRKLQQEKKDRSAEIETQKKDVAKLRMEIEKEGDKHKRAQSALREFYKKKLVKSDQIKSDLKKLEDQLEKERKASKEYAAQLKEAQANAGDLKELKKTVEALESERDELGKEKDKALADLVHAKKEAEETQKKLDQIKQALGT